jgi:hypothetical protein
MQKDIGVAAGYRAREIISGQILMDKLACLRADIV